MAIVTTRTELLEQRAATGVKTTLLWLLNNGLTSLESNITTAVNTASIDSGHALAADGDRTIARRDVRALNLRADEIV